jgi:uncharacterized membrane protein YdjX (TVP38/TMEM64 family)
MKLRIAISSGVPFNSFSIISNIGTVPKRLFGAGGGVQDEYRNSLTWAVEGDAQIVMAAAVVSAATIVAIVIFLNIFLSLWWLPNLS